MEGLIIIVLFVIFSIIKQLLEKGKVPLPREGGEDMPLPYEEEDMPPFRRRKKEPAKVPGEDIDGKEVWEKAREKEEDYSPAVYSKLGREVKDQEFYGKEKTTSSGKVTSGFKAFNRDSLVQGVVFSEVIGLPRSRKPFPLKQFNKVYK